MKNLGLGVAVLFVSVMVGSIIGQGVGEAVMSQNSAAVFSAISPGASPAAYQTQAVYATMAPSLSSGAIQTPAIHALPSTGVVSVVTPLPSPTNALTRIILDANASFASVASQIVNLNNLLARRTSFAISIPNGAPEYCSTAMTDGYLDCTPYKDLKSCEATGKCYWSGGGTQNAGSCLPKSNNQPPSPAPRSTE